jgi:hypothetical protein
MRSVRILTTVVLVIGGALIGMTAMPVAAGNPTITVTPSTGLVDGQSVVARVHGLPSHISVLLVQCVLSRADACPGGVTVVTNGSGRAATGLVVGDAVPFQADVHPDPYAGCRDDSCQIFAVWIDEDGNQRVAESASMEFVGSPATLSATPTDELVAGQRVRASGSALGGEGRTLVVAERQCSTPGFITTCLAAKSIGSTVVRSNGRWGMSVKVRRDLPHRYADCSVTELSDPDFDVSLECQLIVFVLDAAGQPDFGFSTKFGVPAIGLDFVES